MQTPHAVAHGDFGRACLYELDKAMAPHAHREGHLLFHVSGPPADVVVDGRPVLVAPGRAAAVSPWQPHYYRPRVKRAPVQMLVLYIRPSWFVAASRQAAQILRFGRPDVEMTDRMTHLCAEMAASLSLTGDTGGHFLHRLSALTQAAYDLTWQWTPDRAEHARRTTQDFRIRRALRLLEERLCEPCALSAISREAGLSRPHFFKLFREQVGLPPTLYVNALRMERAIERLALGADTVSDIGLDLGFSTPASFSRFFIANSVVPPSVYRRSLVARAVG
jgi:AraC-like DNA-binding protein